MLVDLGSILGSMLRPSRVLVASFGPRVFEHRFVIVFGSCFYDLGNIAENFRREPNSSKTHITRFSKAWYYTNMHIHKYAKSNNPKIRLFETWSIEALHTQQLLSKLRFVEIPMFWTILFWACLSLCFNYIVGQEFVLENVVSNVTNNI